MIRRGRTPYVGLPDEVGLVVDEGVILFPRGLMPGPLPQPTLDTRVDLLPVVWGS